MISTILTNLKFEFTSRKRFVSPYLFWLLFFSLIFLMVLAAGRAFPSVNVNFGLGQKVMINSPKAITVFYSLLLIFGVLVIAPIFGQAAAKDFENKFDAVVFATPAHRIGFFIGRYLGAALFSILIFSGLGLGMFLASSLPFVQQSLFGENRLSAYILPYLVFVIPNILIFGSITFAVGAYTKRMAPVYVAGILSFMANIFGNILAAELDHKTLRSLIDPFGMNALEVVTEYWSVAEQNSRVITFEGVLLWNRLIWLFITLALVAFAITVGQRQARGKRQKADDKAAKSADLLSSATPQKSMVNVLQRPTNLDFSPSSRLKLFASQTWFEVKSSVKNVYFMCLALAGFIFLIFATSMIGKMYGTETYPVTWKIVQAAAGNFTIFLYIIMIFFAGELLWRDRSHRMNQILDAFPTPPWISFFAKFTALQIVLGFLLFMVSILGATIQLAQGYTKFEFGQVYYTLFTFHFPQLVIYSTLFFFIHSLVNNKFLGHGLAIAYLIASSFMVGFGFERLLYRFPAGAGSVFYSDMNGYGALLSKTRHLQLYWGLAAVIFFSLAYVFVLRGTDDSWASRLKEARVRFNGKLKILILVVLSGFVAQGAFIYYNTDVLNSYKSSEDEEKDRLYLEQTYRKDYYRKPQLAISSVKAFVDIFPESLALKAKLKYVFENRNDTPVSEVFVMLPFEKEHFNFQFDREIKLKKDDERINVLIYEFATPLAPGERVNLDLGVDYRLNGFQNGSAPTFLAANGTFFNNGQPFPSFGYEHRAELSSDSIREKYNLAPKARMNSIRDEEAKNYTYISGREGDWIDFEATVSTSKDQIAIAPGYLQKEWMEGDRRYFHYTMDQKILNFYSFLSGRYESKKDKWNDVNLEILYHKGHEYNLDNMMAASKDGLDYFTKNFGPYQHKQFRIIEFPRYASFAQSFPNTIPYSEAIGFIARVDPKDEDDIDYPYYVTAHELAHQWWAHQVIGADVQGATLMSESLSEYSALMVLEQKYGREKMGRFLKYGMDSYLTGRAQESKGEHPLTLVENQQYIHYNKGSLSLFALKEVVGEDALNKAIRAYLEKVKFQKPPFTTSLEFVSVLKKNLPEVHHRTIDDLFSNITLFDNRIIKANVKEEGGQFKVDLDLLSKKIYVETDGTETDGDLDQEFLLTFKGKDGKLLKEELTRLKSGENKVSITLSEKPDIVHLDELGIWIDKVRSDNKYKF